jgi:HSP20 family molecular chaperone IbpA
MYTDLMFENLFFNPYQPYRAAMLLNSGFYQDQPYYPMRYVKTDNSLDVYIKAPGLKPESIEVQVDGSNITVKALTRPIPGFSYEPGEMLKKFSTSHIFTLNPDTTKVEYQDGILHIYVERLESEKPKSFKLSSLDKIEDKPNEILTSGASEQEKG